MKTKIEKINDLSRKLTIEIPRNDVLLKNKNKLENLSKTVQIKGFRKGKVPINVIKHHFGKEIYQDVISELLNKCLNNFLTKEDLKITNKPILKSLSDNKNENLKFILNLELFPKINIELNKIEVKKYITSIEKKNIIKKINDTCTAHGQWHNITLNSKKNDKLKIDIISTTKKYNHKNITINLDGKDTIFLGLYEKLINTKINTTHEYYLENNTLSINKTSNVKLKITIKTIKRFYPAKIDEELAKLLKLKNNDIKNLNTFIETKLINDSKIISNNLLKGDILKNLINTHNFPIPTTLLEQEKLKIKTYTTNTEKNIVKNIKLKLLLDEFKIKYNINVSEEKIKNIYSLYSNKIKNKEHKTIVLQTIINNLYTDEIINIIISKINIPEEIITFDNLLKKGETI